MSKIEELIACGDIKAEDLLQADNLIEQAKLVQEGLNASKQTISFPLGEKKVKCYLKECKTVDNESYNVLGECANDGELIIYSVNGEMKTYIGSCNLLNFESVFMAFSEGSEFFVKHLHRFLKEQIEKQEQMIIEG